MALAVSRVTLVDGNGAVSIVSAGLKRMVIIRIIGGDSEAYIGPSGVTASTGMRLDATTPLPIALDSLDALYGVALAGYGDMELSIMTSTALL